MLEATPYDPYNPPDGRVHLSDLPAGRAIVHLKAWTGAAGASAGVTSLAIDGARLKALGPREWLLLSDALGGPALQAAVAAWVRERGIAAVDLSQGIGGLCLAGPGVRDMLSTSCGLDLHSRSFPVGSCTRTRLAQLPVVIDHMGAEPRYELYVGISYLPYLRSWLLDAASGN
ncbi:MAG TPA: sarcosine oxidase subunit gamma family protein [Steroidobacteraceae bacterium]|jgi:heterotetrameric sarcosine oxidase gamma subunit|nr:sarcosine oxidase subunit gamma family protein [Steroidobacteraceae bacterium]